MNNTGSDLKAFSKDDPTGIPIISSNSWSSYVLVSLEKNTLQKFIVSSRYPFRKPIANPIDMLPVSGIPRFDRAAI
jgi:hypothetical protein